MKVAISSEGPDLKYSVSRRFGVSSYLLIVDMRSGTLDVVQNPGATAQRAAGIHAVVQLLSQDVHVLLTGYCSPAARQHLEANGVQVHAGLSGVAEDILQRYRNGEMESGQEERIEIESYSKAATCDHLYGAARRSWNQFLSMLPILGGAVLLVGLFNSFVSRHFVASLFSGNAVSDTFWGACAGSVFTGNPINSYVIGGELLKQGVSLFAVTAFMLTWVTVGLVQLPAEIAALGRRFAILRNVVCLISVFLIALATVAILTVVTGTNS